MKHKNIGLKAAQRAAAPAAKNELKNPEGVEILLAKRRQKFADEKIVIPPPDRSDMFGELKHPTILSIVTGWFEVTPLRAQTWLDHNIHNRNVNKGKVVSFARQIVNGDYVDTHQGVAFNEAGDLIDGQHFLKAVVMTNLTVRRMVTFGLPNKPSGKNFTTMDVVDTGGRSVADQLKISHGITESGPKKQICIALATLCYGARTRNLSVGQTLDVLKAFEFSVEFFIRNRAKEAGLRQIGVLAGFAFAHAATSLSDKGSVQHRVEQLFRELNTGEGLINETAFQKNQKDGRAMRPIEHLRYFLTGAESVFFNKSMNRCIAEVTLQAIYAEIQKVRTTELEQAEVGLKWFAAKQKDRVDKIAEMFRLPEKL